MRDIVVDEVCMLSQRAAYAWPDFPKSSLAERIGYWTREVGFWLSIFALHVIQVLAYGTAILSLIALANQ